MLYFPPLEPYAGRYLQTCFEFMSAISNGGEKALAATTKMYEARDALDKQITIHVRQYVID